MDPNSHKSESFNERKRIKRTFPLLSSVPEPSCLLVSITLPLVRPFCSPHPACRRAAVFVIRFVFAFAFACSALALTLSPDEEAARDAALQWLGVVDSAKYNDAALMMSEQVRGTRDWANYFAVRRVPLGRASNRQMTEIKHAKSIPSDPELRPHAIIRFRTSFERKAAAAEEIVMTKMGCCWEVSGYSIIAVASDM